LFQSQNLDSWSACYVHERGELKVVSMLTIEKVYRACHVHVTERGLGSIVNIIVKVYVNPRFILIVCLLHQFLVATL